ncbi:Ribose ABC transport system, ATP-binding protein RbsA [Sinorhizobium alkalisoli]|nr:Ribose ABC transport system, ATP-binding protein RbsA [Sinorhizobium alkalisoli]
MSNPAFKPSPAAPAAGIAPLLETKGLMKRYPGVVALADMDFDLRAGEVHVLFGENGAGKSTLISLLAGAGEPSEGSIVINGKTVCFKSVHDARAHGVRTVFQEFSLVPQLTVEQNMFLGQEFRRGPFLDKAALRRNAREILDRLGFDLDLQALVATLARADQQMVEIAKAFTEGVSVLILDEPTASLTEKETDRLFALIEMAKRAGTGIIYITHRMAEIRRIGDRITVMRDGRKIVTLDVDKADDQQLIEKMTGRVIDQIYPDIRHDPGELMLELDGVSLSSGMMKSVSLNVRAGEVVGIAGLVGSGKGSVGRAVFGLERVAGGTIRFKARDVTGSSVSDMMKQGLFYIPSDRKEEGLVTMRGTRENIALSSLDSSDYSRFGWLRRGQEMRRARELARDLKLRPMDLERAVEQFSGGNQQKVMIAKALAREIDFFIFDEPTVGVDVGTRASIYGLIGKLCEAGAGVLLISSDLPEILNLTHRAYVMYRGEVRAELHGADITQENVLGHFFERDA